MAYSPLPPLGQTTKSASLPVTVASDQGTLTTNATLQAGSAIAGKVGIDQTTVGTTNAVSLAQVGANTILTGNGVTGTGSQRVTIASDNTAFSVNATLQSGANVIGALTANQSVNNAQVNGVTVLTGNGTAGTGCQRVTIASDNSALSTTAASGEYARLPATNCSRIISAAASTNATSAKGSAGALKGIQGYNASTSAKYLKFYDKASAPTVGTDTPVKTIHLPAGADFAIDFPAGFKFSTGIAYALTGAAADADTTALTAGDIVCLNVDYL